jgi:hypothetical protein
VFFENFKTLLVEDFGFSKYDSDKLLKGVQNVENYSKGVPGEPLSIALSALIGWSVTLRRLIKVISKN